MPPTRSHAPAWECAPLPLCGAGLLKSTDRGLHAKSDRPLSREPLASLWSPKMTQSVADRVPTREHRNKCPRDPAYGHAQGSCRCQNPLSRPCLRNRRVLPLPLRQRQEEHGQARQPLQRARPDVHFVKPAKPDRVENA